MLRTAFALTFGLLLASPLSAQTNTETVDHTFTLQPGGTLKLKVTQSGNTINVDANHRLVERRNDNVVETDFDIQVPSRTKLDIKTFSAPVTVVGVSETQHIDGFSSDIRVEAAQWMDGSVSIRK